MLIKLVNGQPVELSPEEEADILAEWAANTPDPLTVRRTAVVAAINATRNTRLAAGAPYAGKLIEVTDKGRADLGGMATAAILASQGLVPWSDGYATGWITMDNTRIPLPTPADGITLAAAVGDWYGRTMQHARDLKDAALASDEPETVDIETGWP